MGNPNLTALRTIARREVMRILRIWAQTLVPPAITMTLYFLIFGKLIGARIGDMGGFSYMDFIVPGLVMMAVIQNAYGNISSSFFGAKFGRHVEELLVSPMPNWVILGGYVVGGVLRGLMVGAIVLVIAMLFTHVRVLPEWASTATHANPIFYMVNAFRYGLLGESAIDMPLWSAFAVMVGFVIALTWLALRLLTKGVGLRS